MVGSQITETCLILFNSLSDNYCGIILLFRFSLNVGIGLNESSFPSPWSYPNFVWLYVVVVDMLGEVAHHLTNTYYISRLPRITRGKNVVKSPRPRNAHGYRIAIVLLSRRTPIAFPLRSRHSARGRSNVVPRQAPRLSTSDLRDLVYHRTCE